MTKLADAIQRVLRNDSTPMGFGAARPAAKATMLVGVIASEAAALAGADVALLELSAAAKDTLSAARKAAGNAPLGVRIAGIDAEGVKAAKAAGADFVLVDQSAPAAALLEEDMGYVLALPAQPEEAFLRSLDALSLEGLYLESLPSHLTVAGQIELARVGLLGRKPLICKVAASAGKEELHCLRNAGVSVLLTSGTAADIAKLRETVMSLPPRRQRREERPVVSLPRGRPSQADDDDDDDDDDSARRPDERLMVDEGRLRELAQAEEPRAAGIGPAAISLQRIPEATELLFIRHAQMPPSTDPRDDQALTDLGREQAEALAAFLARSRPLRAVYSSPTQRCRETAEPVARRQGLTVQVEHDLREIESYVPEGTTLREVLGEEGWERMRQRMISERTWDVRGPLSESSASLRGRVTAVADQIVRQHSACAVAVVTHGPVINAFLASVLSSPYDLLLQPGLTSVTSVLALGDRREERLLNSMAHFGVLSRSFASNRREAVSPGLCPGPRDWLS